MNLYVRIILETLLQLFKNFQCHTQIDPRYRQGGQCNHIYKKRDIYNPSHWFNTFQINLVILATDFYGIYGAYDNVAQVLPAFCRSVHTSPHFQFSSVQFSSVILDYQWSLSDKHHYKDHYNVKCTVG